MGKPSSPHLRAPIRVETTLAVGDRVDLGEGDLAKLAFREINVKEAFTLVDGTGAFFRASLKGATTTSGDAVVYERMPASTESNARVTLVCAVLGRQRMLPVIQKATELGCVR